jgi:prophage regulatory protein
VTAGFNPGWGTPFHDIRHSAELSLVNTGDFPMSRLLRYDDLVERGIVRNRPTLYRWIAEERFPPGMLLGENTRAWRESDVEDWLASRPVKGTPRAKAAA